MVYLVSQKPKTCFPQFFPSGVEVGIQEMA